MLEKPLHFNFASDVIGCWAKQRPDAPAFWWMDETGGSEVKYTFSQLAAECDRAANCFRKFGVKRGDHVLVLLPRLSQWWIGMLGLIRLGAVPVPGTPLLTPRDLHYRIDSARIAAIFTDVDGAGKLPDFAGVRMVAGGGCPAGWLDFDAGMRESTAEFHGPPTLSDDPGIIYFTSATTGYPKMVLHTQASYGLAHRLTGQLWLDLGLDDLHWNISDVGWGKAAWSSFYGPWHMGACVFAVDLRGKFDPLKILGILQAYPVTTLCSPTTALRLVVRQDLSAFRFPRLRHVVTAGEPLNPEIVSIWKKATGLTIHEGYGQTETVILIGNFRSLGCQVRPGSMGKANPHYEVGLLDDDLNEVPPGHEGEIAVRVRPDRPVGLFREYWQHPEATARQFRGNWYLTGDRATRDAEGYFWFVGRKDDVIKSSGYRIGPFEVESALMEHEAVLDVAVVGKPDAIRGQIVKAFVILRNDGEGSDALKAELQRHCKQIVAPYKYPREIEFVSELPKTTSGKTRHVELREREKMATQEIGRA